ncbi:protein transport protein S31 [Cryptotrichosporon argae]
MKLKAIPRTATFAWSHLPAPDALLVTGPAAGALDENFTDEGTLEVWDALAGDVKGSVTVSSRFHRLAWSAPGATAHGRGVIAAGMETGEVFVFNPTKIIEGADADESRIYKNHKHTGGVRGLDWNPNQQNLLLSGATSAELFIHDLNNPDKVTLPGPTSTRLNEITALQWNPTVARIFAASSSSGFTSVWDLKAGKEIVALQYGGGVAKGMDAAGGAAAGLQQGKRRGMSDVVWHPELATRLVTASEDDESPVIMLWDLRNTRAPERILSGHTKGVLSLSWCKQDPDLLLSCGKDNRTLMWNPQTGDIVGETPATADWSFQTSWSPRNPDLIATASFDGHINVHSLQTTQLPPTPSQTLAYTASADDVFGALGKTEVEEAAGVSLTQPPKWLRRPVSASFGYGGLLTSTSNLSGASGKHQSGVVHIRHIVTEPSIIERAQKLDDVAGDKDKLAAFCDSHAEGQKDTAWKALQTLFTANSRDELVRLLGFSKDDVAKQVGEAIKHMAGHVEEDESPATPTADGAQTPQSKKAETTSPSAASITKSEHESEDNKDLFDDHAPGTPAADFFSSLGSVPLRNPQLDAIIPHQQLTGDVSVAATVGSRASSVRDETITESNTFPIYPPGESDVDKLITQALVLGDFASAVDLCLASERYADALLLAVRGGPELLASTQKAYFAKRTVAHPFLRVFQSIVTEDLADIVQNADLAEWRVVFVVVCTFARDGDFANLAEQLGQRLQYKWQTLAASDDKDKDAAKQTRTDATLCYLAARRLEKVVSIWIDEMNEEERANTTAGTRYSSHAHALQSFIEKVAVFQAATAYVDQDLTSPASSAAEAEARTYVLAGLYDRFYEYADLLATQGLVDIAAKYVKMTPPDYRVTSGFETDRARERILAAARLHTPVASSSNAGKAKQGSGYGYAPAPAAYPSTSYPTAQPPYGAPAAPAFVPQPAAPAYAAPPSAYAPPPTTAAYTAPPPAFNTYAPPPSAAVQPTPSVYAPSNPAPAQPATNTYGGSSSYAPANTFQPYAPNGFDPQPQGYGAPTAPYGGAPVPPPPRMTNGDNGPPIIPASQRRDMPGWNDAPSLSAPKRPASVARETPKPAAITSPFPMAEVASTPTGPPSSFTSPNVRSGALPPPPRGGPRPPSAQAGPPPSRPPPPSFAPPPQAQQPLQSPGIQSQSAYAPPTQARAPPPSRPPPGRGGPPPPGVMAGPPPPRALSPLNPNAHAPPSLSSQLGSPPSSAAPLGVSSPPPGARVGGPPPPGRGGPPPPQVAAPPAAPAKPTHPPGDRSHIAPSSHEIYDVFSAEFARVKTLGLPAHVKKIVDDTERRLNILFDALNNDAVPTPTVETTRRIAGALKAGDPNGALAVHVELLTTATGETTVWAPGIKQLIRLGL